jgi:hypothetical protein
MGARPRLGGTLTAFSHGTSRSTQATVAEPVEGFRHPSWLSRTGYFIKPTIIKQKTGHGVIERSLTPYGVSKLGASLFATT